MPPDLAVGRAYSPALCFQDAADKELFDPLPDIKVQSSFVVSLGVAERAEFHAKTAAETFPRGPSLDYCSAADGRGNGLLALNGPFSTAAKPPLTTAGVFGHEGGRLVAPNTGEFRPTGPSLCGRGQLVDGGVAPLSVSGEVGSTSARGRRRRSSVALTLDCRNSPFIRGNDGGAAVECRAAPPRRILKHTSEQLE